MASTESATNKTKAFRLLDLPTELQLAIFEFAVVSIEPICITECWAWPPDWRPRACQPALTRTSKSIRHVTLNMFYRRNIFEVDTLALTKICPDHTTWLVAPWLTAIGWQNRNNLRGVWLDRDLEPYVWESGRDTPQEWLKKDKFLSSLGAEIVHVREDPKRWQLVFNMATILADEESRIVDIRNLFEARSSASVQLQSVSAFKYSKRTFAAVCSLLPRLH